jgi:ATP-dependent exoDNAse (exonuclease V) alpha subunit
MRGVKLLIIDEDSTNPLHCLGTIDQQLRIANGSNKPFGNAHVIYAGDMRQLKSVLSTDMYEQPPFNSSTDPKRIAFNNKLSIGRNRYMEISDYIELTKQFRQQKSKQLGDTLGRCRINTEQQKDLDLLNTRFMPNMEEALIEIQSKPNAICLASTRKVVDDINKKFNNSLIDRGKRSITCYALHRKQRTQQTRALASREVANENNDNENQFDQERVLNTTDVLDSGLSSTQRLKCLQHDIDGKSGKLSSCLTLCIGSRVMLIENVDPMLGLVNGTTGTVVGFVYGTFEGSNKIIENPTDINIAATHEPQIPIVLMKVDEEFWTAPQHKFIIKPPLETQRNWERVIAIPPVESRVSYKLKFANGQESVKRIQLPLILAFGITVHKAQGLNKDYVLFIASSRLFARAISYVALSRCTSLEGLYIVGKKITTEHFNQIYGKEDNVIKAETYRLRKFQGNTLRKGYKALCTFKRHLYNEDTPFTFPLDEPEFDA